MIDPILTDVVAEQSYPLLFATLSGAHLYGFASPDSDYDLRGIHLLPVDEVVGLRTGPATIVASMLRAGRTIDLVTHDARKFFELLLKRNGYVLEQLTSPLVVATAPAHDELLALVPGCLTRRYSHHYLGFAANQWRLFAGEQPRRIKPLLYAYRVLLTGIHLMRTGEVEANLVRLNERFGLPYLPELIARKVAGSEHEVLTDANAAFHEGEYGRLVGEFEAAAGASRLPDAPTASAALHELLVRLRLGRGRLGTDESIRG